MIHFKLNNLPNIYKKFESANEMRPTESYAHLNRISILAKSNSSSSTAAAEAPTAVHLQQWLGANSSSTTALARHQQQFIYSSGKAPTVVYLQH